MPGTRPARRSARFTTFEVLVVFLAVQVLWPRPEGGEVRTVIWSLRRDGVLLRLAEVLRPSRDRIPGFRFEADLWVDGARCDAQVASLALVPWRQPQAPEDRVTLRDPWDLPAGVGHTLFLDPAGVDAARFQGLVDALLEAREDLEATCRRPRPRFPWWGWAGHDEPPLRHFTLAGIWRMRWSDLDRRYASPTPGVGLRVHDDGVVAGVLEGRPGQGWTRLGKVAPGTRVATLREAATRDFLDQALGLPLDQVSVAFRRGGATFGEDFTVRFAPRAASP